MGGGSSKEKEKPTAVKPTAPTPLYNCTDRDEGEFNLQVTVKNITNTTEVLCRTILEVPDDMKNASISDEAVLCNHLGDTVCSKCANNTLFTANYTNINISCQIDETTTPTIATTVIDTTLQITSTDHTTAAIEESALMNILIIVVCVVVFLILVAVIFICCKRKRNKDGKQRQNGNQEPAVRVQSDETGELYTVVNKPQNDSTNAYADDRGTLYLAAEDVEIIENGELYTEVDKMKIKNGSSKSKKQKGKKQTGVQGRDTVQEVLYDSNPAGQEANNELYSVVDKKKSQNGGGGDDAQLYNVLYKDGQ